jgi:hypothetical protein
VTLSGNTGGSDLVNFRGSGAHVNTAVIARPPVANAQAVTLVADTSQSITLTASGPNSQSSPNPLALTYAVTVGPAHGTLSGTAPELTYTPDPGYGGPDSFQFEVNNGYFDSSPATVSLTVQVMPSLSGLSSPTVINGTATTTLSGHLVTSPLAPPAGEVVSITLNNVTQLATLDGDGNFSATFNTAGLSVAGSPYTVSYSYAGDAAFTAATGSSTLTVLSYVQAVDNLQAQVDAHPLPSGFEQSLDSKLRAAADSFNRGDRASAVNQLGAFINAVSAQRGKKVGDALADALITYAEQILDAVG